MASIEHKSDGSMLRTRQDPRCVGRTPSPACIRLRTRGSYVPRLAPEPVLANVSRPKMSVGASTMRVMESPGYTVRTSGRRKRTMTAFRENGEIVVVVPASMPVRDRQRMVPALVNRFLSKEERRGAPRGDDALTQRASELFDTYLRPAIAAPVSDFGVRWVTNMATRWGSCSTQTGEIRLSHRLQTMPNWVVDYVLVHELAHLVERNHTAQFHALVAAYPHTQKAIGFLEGWQHAREVPDH